MLPRSHRFHGLGSLNFTYKQGQTVRGPLLSLKSVRNAKRKTYRVAIVVSRKVSKSAVVRNRIRRRIYEAMQTHKGRITEPYDLVFTAFSEQLAEIDFAELQRQVDALLKKAGITGGGRGIVSTEGKTGGKTD